MPSFRVGEFDHRLVSEVFTDENGNPRDLSTALITFELVDEYGNTSTPEGVGTSAGVAYYDLQASDLAIPGWYTGMFTALNTGNFSVSSDPIIFDVFVPGRAAGEIASIAAVKSLLRIPQDVTDHDGALGILVESAEQDLLDITGLDRFSVATYSEKHDVEWAGQREFRVDRRWIQSVAALTNNGTALVEGTGFYFNRDTGYIHLIPAGHYFVLGAQTIDVTYEAGLIVAGATPADLRKCLIAMVAREWNTMPRAGIASEQIGRRKIEMARGADATRDEVERILAKYRRVFE